MQVNHQIFHSQLPISEAPLELKQGEVYRASIKEKLNNTDAILQIRGKEVHAKFSEGVPTSENRVTILVNGQSDQMVNVKTITTENAKTATSEEKIFNSLGITGKEHADLKQVVRVLLDKGSPLSKEVVGELKEFMEKTTGTLEAKIETVRALANKRLEATHTQLRAIHEALHGKPLNEVLSNIAKEIDPEFKLEKADVANAKQQNPIPQKENVQTSKAVETQPVDTKIVKNTVTEAIRPSQSTANVPEANTSQLSDIVRNSRERMEKEPDLKKAIQQIREEIVKNPKIDRDLAQRVEKAAQEAEKLQSIGKDRLLQALLKEASPLKESLKQVGEQIQTESDTKKILQKVQDLVTNNKNINPETIRNIERLTNQATQLDQAGRERLTKMLQQVEITLKLNKIGPSESIKQALMQLQKEPNLERAIDQVRKEITSNPNIDSKTIDKAEKALNEAQQLQDKGREIAARQHITKELTEIQQELAKTESKINLEQKATQEAVQYDINEQLQSLNIQAKDILVTKVSQKLAQATHDFRELKREITRNLDNVERIINTFKQNAYPQAKQMLETAISKLDNAILKSDMMLFTDMKTEKQLMNASTQLADAKKLLAKGDHAEANKIVNEVKTLVDKLIFKPSEQKIMHYVNKESMILENRTSGQQMLSQFSVATHGTVSNQEPSARQMYEMVRSLGLNHESDVANSLVFQKNDQSQQEQQQQQNLKEALMKLAQGEGQETNPKIAQQADQALTNLTGQQLLSKSDATGTLQSMFFNLPLMLGEKPENLQVFINSKNEGQQVEWENCNLYFLLETKKLGDVGILLNSTDRNLSITIKNDLPGFKEKIEPLASFTKEKLQEVGYNVSSINFARMNPVRSQSISHEGSGNEENQAKSTRQVFAEKGMDFTI